jgi:hypothetical protein
VSLTSDENVSVSYEWPSSQAWYRLLNVLLQQVVVRSASTRRILYKSTQLRQTIDRKIDRISTWARWNDRYARPDVDESRCNVEQLLDHADSMDREARYREVTGGDHELLRYVDGVAEGNAVLVRLFDEVPEA